MASANRTKGPRAVIVNELREMARLIKLTAGPWTGHMATQISDPVLGKWRKRRPDELPENMVSRWETLARDMAALEKRAAAVREAAVNQADELRRMADN